jgi:hypothetical protein
MSTTATFPSHISFYDVADHGKCAVASQLSEPGMNSTTAQVADEKIRGLDVIGITRCFARKKSADRPTNKQKHHLVTISMTGRFWSACLWPLMAVIARTSFAWDVVRCTPSSRRGISLTSARQNFALAPYRRQPRQQLERASSPTPLFMAVRNRGLEVRKETATPTGERGGSCGRFQVECDVATCYCFTD